MADNTQQIILKISGDSQEAQLALNKLIEALDGLNKKVTSAGDVAKGVFGGELLTRAFDGIVHGIEKVVEFLPELIQQTAETADHFWVLSKQTGIAANALTELQYVGEQTGTSLESITTNIFQMSRRIGDATSAVTGAVRDLGLNMDQLRKESPEEQFRQIIDALGQKGIAGTAREAADGTAIFGRQFRQMRQVVGQNINELIERFHALGGGMNDAFAELGNKFTDVEADFKTLFNNLKAQIGIGLLPAVTTILGSVMDAIVKTLQDTHTNIGNIGKDMQSSMEGVVRIVAQGISAIAAALPGLVDIFLRTFEAISLVMRNWALDFAKILGSAADAFALFGDTEHQQMFLALSDASLRVAIGIDAMGAASQKNRPAIVAWLKALSDNLKDPEEIVRRYKAAVEEINTTKPKDKTGKVPLTPEEISKVKDAEAQLQKALIQIQTEGLEQKIKLFDIETSEQMRHLQEGGAKAEIIAANAAAREKERELLLVEFKRGLRDQSIKMVDEAMKREIEIQLKGQEQKEELIRAGVSAEISAERLRIGEVAAAEGAFQQFRAEKIKDGEDQIRKIRHDAAEETRLQARESAYASAEETINITQEGLTKEISLLQLNANKKLDALKELHLSEQEEEKRADQILMDLDDQTDAAITKNKKSAYQQRLDDAAEYQTALVKLTEFGRKAAIDEENIAYEREFERLQEKKARDTENEAAINAEIEHLRQMHNLKMEAIDNQYLGRTKAQVKLELQAAQEDLRIMKLRGDATTAAIRQKEEQIKGLKAELSVMLEIVAALSKVSALSGIVADAFGQLGAIVGGQFGKVLNIISQVADAVQTFAEDTMNLLSAIAKGDWIAAIAAGIKIVVDGFKKLYHLFAKSPEQRAGEEAARDYGIRISKEFAKAIAEQADKEFGGSRQAAMIFNLDKLIQSAGGLDVHSVDTFRNFKRGLMDIFVMFDTGKFSADQFTDALQRNLEVFMKYAQHDATGQSLQAWAEAADKLFSEFEAGRITVDQLNQALGDTVNELAQMATESPAALETFTAVAARMIDEFRQGKLTAAELNKALSDGFRTITQDAIKHSKILSESFVELMVNARKAGVEIDGMSEFFDAMNSKLSGGANNLLNGFIDQLTNASTKGKKSAADIRIAYQTEFDRISRIVLASFNGMVANGMSAFEAMQATGDSFDKLAEAAEKFGFKGNKAFDQLKRWRELTTANKGLFEELSGVNDIMLALANTGSLDADTFKDLQAQAMGTAAQMKAAGFSQLEIEQALKPTLETILKLHKERGMAIDEETQKMIDQAEADGVLTESQASVQDVLKEGLGEIIKLLGGDLPAAWQKTANAAKKAADDTKKANKDTVDSATKTYGELVSTTAAAASDAQGIVAASLTASSEAASEAMFGTVDDATTAIDNSTKETTTAFTDLLDFMQGEGSQTWQEWSRKAGDATDDTTGGVKDVKQDGVDVLTRSIFDQRGEWQTWRDIAVSAARDVEAAVNAISFGRSPGGLKEIPIQLDRAAKAAKAFTMLGTTQFTSLYKALPYSQPQQNTQDTTGGGLGGPSVAIHINALDPASMQHAIERQVYPEIIKLLRRGGRPLTDLQRIVNS